MGFIEDFYNGNIEPQKRNLKQYSAYTTDFNKLRELEDILKEKLKKTKEAYLLSI